MIKKLTVLAFGMIFLMSVTYASVKNNGSNNFLNNNNTPPNIVLIIADDMGWDVFGSYINSKSIKARTPVIDSLSKMGISFTNFWVYPECAPTRAAMLTGKYGFRTGIGGVAGNNTPKLSSSEVIIQKYINQKTENAYATAVIGKWHVSGNTNLKAPEQLGVQFFSGFLPGTVQDYFNWTNTSNGKQKVVDQYTTSYFVDQSLWWIKEQQKPFFLWLSFNAPHTPFQRPPKALITDEQLAYYQKAGISENSVNYLASIEAMDKEIGRLIGGLTEAQKTNTVIIFMGDNGTPARVAQWPASPRTAKSTLFQGGVNVPLIVCGKNVTRKNVTDQALVQATDMFSTIAEIAGINEKPNNDGLSIMPLFQNKDAWRRKFVYTEFFGSGQGGNEGYAVRNATYKLIHLNTGREFLYKIDTDPFEQSNLFDQTLTAQSKQELAALRDVQANISKPN